MDNKVSVDESIRSLIVKVANFPRDGINFTDITPVLEQNPVAFRAVIDRMSAPHRAEPPEVVVCIEAMGFVFGAPVAYHLGSRIVMARRAGKLPRPTLQITYDMGYDRNRQMHIHIGAIVPGSRVLIIDDVLAVGGTVLWDFLGSDITINTILTLADDFCYFLLMARRPRVFAPGLLYHIIVRGNQHKRRFVPVTTTKPISIGWRNAAPSSE